MLLNYTAEASAGSNSTSLCCRSSSSSHTCFTAPRHTHITQYHRLQQLSAFPSAASSMSQVLQRGKFHFLPSPRVTSQLTTNCSYATLAGDTRTTRQPPTSYSCSSSLLFTLPFPSPARSLSSLDFCSNYPHCHTRLALPLSLPTTSSASGIY